MAEPATSKKVSANAEPVEYIPAERITLRNAIEQFWRMTVLVARKPNLRKEKEKIVRRTVYRLNKAKLPGHGTQIPKRLYEIVKEGDSQILEDLATILSEELHEMKELDKERKRAAGGTRPPRQPSKVKRPLSVPRLLREPNR